MARGIRSPEGELRRKIGYIRSTLARVEERNRKREAGYREELFQLEKQHKALLTEGSK